MKTRLAMTLLRRYGPALAAMLAARAATAKGRSAPMQAPTRAPTQAGRRSRSGTGSILRDLGRLASELRRR